MDTYRYNSLLDNTDWNADEIMNIFCDIPVTITIPDFLKDEISTPAVQTSPRSTSRTNTNLQKMQEAIENIQFLCLQQSEEIYFLKSKIDKIEMTIKKNTVIIKKQQHGEGQRKRAAPEQNPGIALDYTKQTKSRRS